MLAKKYRLAKKQFSLIYKKGRKIYSPTFFIRYYFNNLGYNQYAITVSKKTEKFAVGRNYIKRFILNLIKVNMNIIPINYSIIITVKKTFYKNNILEKNIKKELLEIFNKIK